MSSTFWASYLSGALGILVGNRLDVLKVQAQAGLSSRTNINPASSTLPTSTPPSPTAPSPSHSIPNPGIRALTSYFRGSAAPILGYGALNSLLFLTFNRTLLYLTPHPPPSPTKLAGCSLSHIWLAGFVGGLATWIVSAPSEYVKCRAQLGIAPSAGAAGQTGGSSSSSWQVARSTIQREGIPGLFRGGTLTSMRDAIGYGWYFWSYEVCKRLLIAQRTPDWWAEMKGWEVVVAGGIAGVVTWASVYPLDVVKTRIQCWVPSTGAADVIGSEREGLLGRQRQKPPRTWEVTKEVWKEGGLRAFYRGIGVCSLRAFVVNAVQWSAYEGIMGWMGEKT
jgi:solute carrier family 25 (mitochondrial carnitine/acylcarnitine transporter), member 20/29